MFFFHKINLTDFSVVFLENCSDMFTITTPIFTQIFLVTPVKLGYPCLSPAHHILTHWFTHSLTHTHSLNHSLTRSLTHPLTHSPTHSLARQFLNFLWNDVEELDSIVGSMLSQLNLFQRRALEKDPVRGKMKQRLVTTHTHAYPLFAQKWSCTFISLGIWCYGHVVYQVWRHDMAR